MIAGSPTSSGKMRNNGRNRVVVPLLGERGNHNRESHRIEKEELQVIVSIGGRGYRGVLGRLGKRRRVLASKS